MLVRRTLGFLESWWLVGLGGLGRRELPQSRSRTGSIPYFLTL
jgi:hypothetical protein